MTNGIKNRTSNKQTTLTMEQSIIDGTHLIAKFIGGEYEVHPMFGEGYRFEGAGKDIVGSSFLAMGSFKFDSNWNHLHPVLKQIRYTVDKPNDSEGLELYEALFDGLATCLDIYFVHNDTVLFLTWLNSLTK